LTHKDAKSFFKRENNNNTLVNLLEEGFILDYSSKLHKLIPGGAHTYSRGDDQFPDNAPQILTHGKGAYVWDPNGKRYLDYGMGLRSVILGYANEKVDSAAFKEMKKGNNLTRPTITELEVAEKLCALIPCAEMIKFAKHGSVVTTAALRLARAYTKRKYVVCCRQHPFFSFDDWFIGTTPMNAGIPEEHYSLTLKFDYNNLESLKELYDKYEDQIACVIMEPVNTTPPINGFLRDVKKLCHEKGAVLIFDETITGFRWDLRGAQKYFNVIPDLATFGKAMANGFSVTALAGKEEIMRLGGIYHDQERVFLLSTTHGPEMSSLGACKATIEVLEEEKVIEHIWKYGERLIKHTNALAKEEGIEDKFIIEGYPCSPSFICKDANGTPSMVMRTLFIEKMLEANIMMPWIALSKAHQEEELETTIRSMEQSLKIYRKALENPKNYLKSKRIIKPVFRKFN
jgi:glutamate-1-semialdehyde 2,1-aminomutase